MSLSAADTDEMMMKAASPFFSAAFSRNGRAPSKALTANLTHDIQPATTFAEEAVEGR